MRFKAKLAPDQVSMLHSLVCSMSRLSSKERGSSVLKLDSDTVHLSTTGRSQDTDGIVCFAELAAATSAEVSSIFSDHRIESNAAHNQIVCELDLSQLRTALKSILANSSSDDMGGFSVLKLAKRQNMPCLCLDAATSNNIQVHHAISVRILRPEEFSQYVPPKIPLPQVQLDLGNAGPLRTLMDRLRHLSPVVYLDACMRGELTASVHTDGSSVQTFFKALPRREGAKDPDSPDAATRVKIDTKKLCASLPQHGPALVCFVENEMLVVHVQLAVGFCTHYVPVHFLSNDPCED